MDTGASMFCHNNWCAIKIAHQQRRSTDIASRYVKLHKLDFQNVEEHTGGKRLIHSAKHHKENQLQSLELPNRIA